MDITKYSQLVEYITIVGDPANKNRAYKYTPHDVQVSPRCRRYPQHRQRLNRGGHVQRR